MYNVHLTHSLLCFEFVELTLDLVISDPSITAEAMSVKIGVSKRAVEKNIKELRERGILVHEGSDKVCYWRIIVKP